MIQSFTPTNPAAGTSLTTRRSLPFQARSVLVTSGPNWVTLQPDGYTIPPGTVGLVYPLATADAVATFMLTAPPAGTVPLGPVQQQQSYLEYSDKDAPATPGSIAAPPSQPISVIQQFSILTGVSQVAFSVGLAKALTFTAATVSGAAATEWDEFGVFGVDGSTTLITQQKATITFSDSKGQGAFGLGGANHLFPIFALNCTEPFRFDARLYY